MAPHERPGIFECYCMESLTIVQIFQFRSVEQPTNMWLKEKHTHYMILANGLKWKQKKLVLTVLVGKMSEKSNDYNCNTIITG